MRSITVNDGQGLETRSGSPRGSGSEIPAGWVGEHQIYEGTNQIQRMVMARQLLK